MHKLLEFEGKHHESYAVKAEFARQDSSFRLEFRLSGPMQDLVIPEKMRASRFRDELWKHTCFEAFLQESKSAAYWEFNFSPSRDWAIYRFDSYRERAEADLEAIDLVIQQERYPGELIMKIDIRPKTMFPVGRVGLTAVLEHKGDSRSYWALHHAGQKPDFHAPESFIITL